MALRMLSDPPERPRKAPSPSSVGETTWEPPEALLDVEARLGELLPTPEEAKRTGAKVARETGGRLIPQTLGDTENKRNKAARAARTIARHPEAREALSNPGARTDRVPNGTRSWWRRLACAWG